MILEEEAEEEEEEEEQALLRPRDLAFETFDEARLISPACFKADRVLRASDDDGARIQNVRRVVRSLSLSRRE